MKNIKWDFEPEREQSKKALKELRFAIEQGYGKPCKVKANGCSCCFMWAIYDLVKLKLQ